MAQGAMQLVADEREEQALTCKDCFCWQPVKDGWKCVFSGNKVLGSMHACQYVESRRALLKVVKMAVDES